MKYLKSNDNTLDRLSELPDSLILEILSLLDIRDAVRTTLLSKHWKDLWVTIPCLNFIEIGIYFVYKTLTLWRGAHIREFSIVSINESEPATSLSMDMALWVQFATERKVEDLCVKFSNSRKVVLYLCPPQCLYECSSIRKLTLSGCNLQICGNVKWDRLNSLNLDDCVVSEDVMNQVFSSSPRLQDFTIRCIRRFENFSIRSSSLKKLSIDYFSLEPTELTILAPNLQVLKYAGKADIEFLLIDVSSLTEVHLRFSYGSSYVAVKEALCQILPAIQHVSTVQLSGSCFKVLRDIEGNDSISPLLNVKLLTIDYWLIKLSDVVGLVESFPKLKMLIISWRSLEKQFQQFQFDAENYTESESNILKSNSLQLRTVLVNWDASTYNASLFEFIGFLLTHATMIEKMVIRREGELNSEEMFEEEKKVMSLQRSFPSVELILC